MKKDWPRLTTDDEAERFVAEADLTEYDFSQMTPVRFAERLVKDGRVARKVEDLDGDTLEAIAASVVPDEFIHLDELIKDDAL